MVTIAEPRPSGWRARCLVPACSYEARGGDQAAAESALLDHLALEHATVEPDQEDE